MNAITLLLLLPCADPAIVVESAKPLPEWTRRFERTSGWTGGDGAASVPLTDKRTLWLFADTWIGQVESGRRKSPRMVNNTAAWQSLQKDEPLRFFHAGNADKLLPLLRPTQDDHWYWPGDGVLHNGKLYLFCKLVKRDEAGAPGFQFDWVGNELVQVDNPRDEPTTWKYRRMKLFRGPDELRLGSGCIVDGDHLYVYGLFPKSQCKKLEVPLGVARVTLDKLPSLQFDDWQYWCESGWSAKPENLKPLLKDGAPEMSVGRVKGVEGFVVVYQGLGLGKDILLRHTVKPEGPFGAAVKSYRCPEEGKVFVYASKLHPELATRPGQLIITYCRNIGDLGEHVRQPNLYVPQFVEVQLKTKSP
jgi:hypothetical protein